MGRVCEFFRGIFTKNVTDTNFHSLLRTKRWFCSKSKLALRQIVSLMHHLQAGSCFSQRDAPVLDAALRLSFFCHRDVFQETSMLRSDTLFGKRDSNSPNQPLSSSSPSPLSSGSSPSLSGAGSSASSSGSFHKPVPPGNASSQSASTQGTNEVGSKLIVGPNIKLKGVEITDCDTLVVEGFVEATMDSRVMQIAQNGSFKGSAEIDIAEIHGSFDGDLTVRQKLVIHATGKVSGKIRYGNVVIEEGGQLAGDVQVGSSSASQPAKGLSVAKGA
jgi:cytoskeletal protein CcmA (bactofilin family)